MPKRRTPVAATNENHGDWNTPPEFLTLVRRLDARREIGLDPCSNATSIVGARTNYTRADDGLSHSWRGHGLVFVNPEYDDLRPWVAKGVGEFVEQRPSEREQLVMLITARTDTRWFHDLAVRFDRRLFVRGRIKFLRPIAGPKRVKGSGKFASLVLYAGRQSAAFDTHFGPLGWLA